MGKSPAKKRAKADGKVKVQYAALPWRRSELAGLEILVITSRETHRAVIPKGWPIKGLAPNMTAMREAYEEAGIEGYISMAPVGGYSYAKRMPKGRDQAVRVEVFGLEVSEEHAGFKEMNERTKMWVPQVLAAEMVDEPELKALIADFDPSKGAPQ